MSKLGDLIVRMRLQYDDYKKGLKNANAETKGFAGTLGKIKGVGLAVWGAIGASVVTFTKQFINHSQTMSDKWNVGVNQMKASWEQFLTSLTSWDWEGFGDRMRNAFDAAAKSTAAHDAEFEVKNSMDMRKAAMAEELAQLQILMRDTRKSYQARAKAAQDYLDKVAPLYQQEIDLRKRIYLTDTDEYLKNAGLQANADNRDYLRTFFTDIAPNESIMGVLVEYQKKVQGKKYKLSSEDYKTIDAFYNQYGNKVGAAFSVLARYYQSTNDKTAKKAIDAIMNYDNALAGYLEETRRIRTLQNSALAQVDKEGSGESDDFMTMLNNDLAEGIAEAERQVSMLEDVLDVDIEGPKMDLSALDAADAQIKQFVEDWNAEQEEISRLNGMIESSIVNSIGNGMEAFTDMLFGLEGADAGNILAALMQPFANTAAQLGSMLIAQGIAVEAFKESLDKLQGIPAIAAGTALLAISSAMKSGIRSLAGGGAGAGTSYGGGSYGGASDTVHYDSTLTVIVEGKISGGDIILASKKTQNKWDR